MEMSVKDLYEKVQSGEIISDIDLQREIVYNLEKQTKVIDSLVIGVPLPAFYFWQNENGKYEVLDGKQRIESISKFMNNDLEYNDKNRKNTDKAIQDKINDTKLCVIICSGDEELKREIFYRINTLGVALSNFEVLNGLYSGTYLEGLTDYCKQPNVSKCFGSNSRGNNQYKMLIQERNFMGEDRTCKRHQDSRSKRRGCRKNIKEKRKLIVRHGNSCLSQIK